MATPVFPANITTKIISRRQATRWRSILRDTIEFRAYCCDIDAAGVMGVAKEPVVILSVNPNPICVGEEINWDISASYAPGSTLTTWSITFGDGGSESGVNFPGDTTSGTHRYDTVGTFPILVTLAEGLGKTQTGKSGVTVVECDEPDVGVTWAYVGTDGSGVWFINWEDLSPIWEDRSNGLTGDALAIRCLTMRPETKHLSPNNHEIWAATKNGVYVTTNGGASWAKIEMPDPSNSEFLDSPAAVVSELDWKKIIFDKTDSASIMYILAGKEIIY